MISKLYNKDQITLYEEIKDEIGNVGKHIKDFEHGLKHNIFAVISSVIFLLIYLCTSIYAIHLNNTTTHQNNIVEISIFISILSIILSMMFRLLFSKQIEANAEKLYALKVEGELDNFIDYIRFKIISNYIPETRARHWSEILIVFAISTIVVEKTYIKLISIFAAIAGAYIIKICVEFNSVLGRDNYSNYLCALKLASKFRKDTQ